MTSHMTSNGFSRERSCGRDVSLQLPRSALAPLPLSRFAASDTIQTVEIHDRGEESTSPLDSGLFAAIMDLDCLNGVRGGKAAQRFVKSMSMKKTKTTAVRIRTE
jgi:hypothetical protein